MMFHSWDITSKKKKKGKENWNGELNLAKLRKQWTNKENLDLMKGRKEEIKAVIPTLFIMISLRPFIRDQLRMKLML